MDNLGLMLQPIPAAIFVPVSGFDSGLAFEGGCSEAISPYNKIKLT